MLKLFSTLYRKSKPLQLSSKNQSSLMSGKSWKIYWVINCDHSCWGKRKEQGKRMPCTVNSVQCTYWTQEIWWGDKTIFFLIKIERTVVSNNCEFSAQFYPLAVSWILSIIHIVRLWGEGGTKNIGSKGWSIQMSISLKNNFLESWALE